MIKSRVRGQVEVPAGGQPKVLTSYWLCREPEREPCAVAQTPGLQPLQRSQIGDSGQRVTPDSARQAAHGAASPPPVELRAHTATDGFCFPLTRRPGPPPVPARSVSHACGC